MNLPPLPKHPYMTWTHSERLAILAWGEACVKEFKASVSKRQAHTKYDERQVKCIRFLHSEGLTYKQVNKTYPMSEVTFINIIKHRGAYK